MDSNRLIKRFVYLLGLCAIIASLGLFARPTGVMAVTAADLTITLTSDFLARDSNCSDPYPNAGYVEVSITNKTSPAVTLTNLQIDLTDILSSGSSGTVITSTVTGIVLDPKESPTRLISSLPSGETARLFFFVNYPCVSNSEATIAFNVKVTDLDDNTTFNTGTPTTRTYTVSTRSSISANAGGNIVSMQLGAGASVGQIIPFTVNYNFGNIGSNVTGFNIQPTGDALFDPSCYRLVASDITASSGWETITKPATAVDLTTPQYDNRLNFTGVTNGNTSSLTVVYYYQVLCTNPSGTTMKPFAASRSGTQFKHTAPTSTCATGQLCQNQFVTPVAPSFQISKTASKQYFLQNSTTDQFVTYTVIITNTSQAGSPLQPVSTRIDKIVDTLPTALLYQNIAMGSQVTTSNSTSLPSLNSTGTLNFAGEPTTTCIPSCDGSYLVPAGGSIKLIYTVNIPAGTPSGYYTNYAAGILGSSTVGQDVAVIKVGNAPTAVTMTSFAAYATNDAIRVQWRTSAENNVAGFNLYRATSQNRATATQLNAQLIAAHGASLPYSFNDTTAEAGTEYWYWIEVINTGEANQEVGPTNASIAQQFTIFMPFLSR